MELHLHWYLVDTVKSGTPRVTTGVSEFDLAGIALPYTDIAAGVDAGLSSGLTDYLRWLFSHPDESTRQAVRSKAQRQGIPVPPQALTINAAALDFLQKERLEAGRKLDD